MNLKNILKKENVTIINQDLEWKESIRLATKPLIEQGYVEDRYPEEIIKNTIEFGPYFIFIDKVAFLHTRPEQGVIDNQIAIMLNKKDVDFKDDGSKKVKLFLVFAAKGSEEHLEIMSLIAEILSDEEKIKQMINSKSEEEIYNLMINK